MDRFKRSFFITFIIVGSILDFAESIHSSGMSLQPNHHQFTRRDPDNHHRLVKRGEGTFHGKATFYATGLGACGKTNVDSDFIVALNQPQYQANKWCEKDITIYYGGKSAQAKIMDECPGCAYGSLDMSPALFKHFASEDVGVFYMSWSLDDGSSSPGGDHKDPPPPPPPKIVPVKPPVQKPDLDTDSNDSFLGQNDWNKIFNNGKDKKKDDDNKKDDNGDGSGDDDDKKKNNSNNNNSNKNGASKNGNSEAINFIRPSQQQIEDAFAIDGNLNSLEQLVISLGSLAATSANVVISGN